MSNTIQKPLTFDEATSPSDLEPSAEVETWQDAKVRAAIKAADAGDFATHEEVMDVISKYVPHG